MEAQDITVVSLENLKDYHKRFTDKIIELGIINPVDTELNKSSKYPLANSSIYKIVNTINTNARELTKTVENLAEKEETDIQEAKEYGANLDNATSILTVEHGGTGNDHIDTEPTEDSETLVTSGGIYTAINEATADAQDLSKATGILAVEHGGTGTNKISKNKVFAGPVEGDETLPPSFRTLDSTDIPELDTNKLTSGILPVIRGGTGKSTIDGTPTEDSTNLVTSGGIYTAINEATADASNLENATGILFIEHGGTGSDHLDIEPTEDSETLVTSGGLYTYLNALKSDAQDLGNATGVLAVERGGTGQSTVDDSPTEGSDKMVKSGGVFTALSDLRGDVDDAVANVIAEIVAEAPDSLDTLKEISDWISGHEEDAAGMNTAIEGKVSKALNDATGVLPIANGGTGIKTSTDPNKIFATASSGSNEVAPSFRALVAADLPTVPVTKGGTGLTTATNANSVIVGGSTATGNFQTVQSKSGALYSTGNNLKPQFGTLPVAQGGTGVSTAGQNTVFAGSSTTDNTAPEFRKLVSNDIPNLSITDKTTGTLPVTRGGTGLTTATNINSVVIGNSTTANAALQTVQSKSGAFYSTGNNVKPQFGVLPVAQGGIGSTSVSKNKVFAGPSTGNDAVPGFRVLASADLPVATTSAVGGVSIDTSTGLAISTAGVLSLSLATEDDIKALFPGVS